MSDADLPPEYANMTLRELLDRYDGPGAPECPPELREWLACARKLRDLQSTEVAQP